MKTEQTTLTSVKTTEQTPEQAFDGLQIRIEGNAVRFILPNGESYFKNKIRFFDGLTKGQKVFNAPKSKEAEPRSPEGYTASQVMAEVQAQLADEEIVY